MSKYSPLCEYLKTSGEQIVNLTFKEIEDILGFTLPQYAGQAPWWYNHESHSQAKCGWLAAGYTASVDLAMKTATFVKDTNIAVKVTPAVKNNNNPHIVIKKNCDSCRSEKSLAREKKRNSQEMSDFRNEIEIFLKKTNAPADISRRLKTDLATMTNMPFYGENRGQAYSRTTMSAPEIVYIYCELLISYGDQDFSGRLFDWLSRQQNQTMRKLSKKLNENKNQKGGIWEHSVPVNYTKKILLELIAKKDLDTIKEYLNFIHNNAPQVYLTKEQDDKVNKNFRDTMPENWDWKTGDPFIRYKEAGIFNELDF